MGGRACPGALTGCRWDPECSAGSDTLRSAPRRTVPGPRRRRTGSLRAGSACLHSRRANELLVANQRHIPAGREPGATIFIPLYPFSYLAPAPLGSALLPPQLRAISRRLMEQGLQTLTAGAAALPPAVPALRGMAQSSPISCFTSSLESGHPQLSVSSLSQQEEGALLQGCDQWLQHSSFWYPQGYLTRLFAPQPDRPCPIVEKHDLRSPEPQQFPAHALGCGIEP